MARYDVFVNPAEPGYLLDLQTDLLDHLKTRVVIPLLPVETTPKPLRRLNPVFKIEQNDFVMATHLMSVIPAAMALHTHVGNLSRHHDEIVAALDMLFHGF